MTRVFIITGVLCLICAGILIQAFIISGKISRMEEKREEGKHRDRR